MIKDSLSAPYFMSGAVVKIDTSGNKIWEHRYLSADSLQYFSSLKLVRHYEGCFIGGTHLDKTESRNIIELIKLDKNGNIKYRLPFEMSSNYSYYFSDFKILSRNRIITLYNKTNPPYEDSVFSGAFISDTLGNIISSNEYMKNTDFTALNKIVDNPNPTNILFTGTTDYNSVYERVLVVKTDSTLYAPPVSVNNISQTVPDKFYLNQNYPNPFNNSTQITFGIKKKGIYKLAVYDVTGKLVDKLFNQSLEPGEYKMDFNAEKLSSGIYFYRLESDKAIITKKFVLLK
ncbi:MAG: T9SS type A sorting domain-containing protein [Ignavibacteria bacterium]